MLIYVNRLRCTDHDRYLVHTLNKTDILSFDLLLVPWLTRSTSFRIRLSMENFQNSGNLRQRPKSFERYRYDSEILRLS